MGIFNNVNKEVLSGLSLTKYRDDIIRLSPGKIGLGSTIMTLNEYTYLSLSNDLKYGESKEFSKYYYLYAYNGNDKEPDVDINTKLLIHSDNYPIMAWDNSYKEFQSIPTNGAFNWEFFTIGTDYYLAVANFYNDSSYNIDSKIYKWDSDSFELFQSIPTIGAFDWEFFTIGSDYYLVVANYYNGSTYNADSKIYKWDGDSFELFQSIPTNGAYNWEFFTIDSDYYLAVANVYNDSTYNVDSKIYKWDGNSFELFQSIATNGARDWEFFTIGSDYYLAVANYYNGSTYNVDSKIYKWDGDSFELFQSIATIGARDWKFFTIGIDYYLAVANSRDDSTYNIDSKIYKWDGDSFELFQSIPTIGAFNWEFFTIGSDYYLAVANYYNGSTYNLDSKIYKWNGDSFELFQSIPTNDATNWNFFTIDSDYYLVVANHYNGSTRNIDSKIYKLTDVGFVDSSLSNHSISRVGNTVHLTDEKKFGTSAMYFDGVGDYLEIANSEDWNFGTGDFTIDCWANVNFLYSTHNPYLICIGDPINNNTGLCITLCQYCGAYSGTIFVKIQSLVYSFTTNLNDLETGWHHYTLIRNSTDLIFFIDGVQTGEVLTSNDNIDIGTDEVYIGSRADQSNTNFFNGYIDEFRISKGIARWTENFTPDTSPYTNLIYSEEDGLNFKFSAVKPSKNQFGNTTYKYNNRRNSCLYIPDGSEMKYIGNVFCNSEGNIENVSYDFSPFMMASGGTITYDGDYKIHTFLESGEIEILNDGEVEYLVVAGGGSGGSSGSLSYDNRGGGGGAGGLLTGTLELSTGIKQVTVGLGGTYSSNGENSIFESIIAIGGGKGGIGNQVGSDGGCGGGGGAYRSAGWFSGGIGLQGYNGGSGGTDSSTFRAGGGGGGMGGAGKSAGINAEDGGIGIISSISGIDTYYCGGGGGGGVGSGGLGGGGNGSAPAHGIGTNATPNTGGGGGGSSAYTIIGGNGGSGIVILRYKYK